MRRREKGPQNLSYLNCHVKLPSMAWSWESMWYLDTNHEGKSLGKDGWTYAVDFPAEYHPKKTFTSCVRRRKWIRYRKYVATDSWSVIPPVHAKDPTEEPFLDISAGGHDLPNGAPNETLVWAVTVLGRIFFRQGVTSSANPGLTTNKIKLYFFVAIGFH